MAYNIGDRVKIKEVITNRRAFVEYMEKYQGKTAVITAIDEPINREDKKLSPHIYRLDVDDGSWYWWEHMLEPVSPLQKKIEYAICINAPTTSWEVGKVYRVDNFGEVVNGLTIIKSIPFDKKYFRKLI